MRLPATHEVCYAPARGYAYHGVTCRNVRVGAGRIERCSLREVISNWAMLRGQRRHVQLGVPNPRASPQPCGSLRCRIDRMFLVAVLAMMKVQSLQCLCDPFLRRNTCGASYKVSCPRSAFVSRLTSASIHNLVVKCSWSTSPAVGNHSTCASSGVRSGDLCFVRQSWTLDWL